MRELSKFCRIYCQDNHKGWAELLPYIQNWINNTVTGCTPSELMYGSKRTNTFRKLMPKAQLLEQEEEEIAVNLENAYAKMRRRAVAREKRRKRGT